MKNKLEWEKLNHNSILRGNGFYVSYNENTSQHSMFTDLGNALGAELKDGEETALCSKNPEVWYILEGDFRKEYEEAFPEGFEACLEVYKKHKEEHRSNWSTD